MERPQPKPPPTPNQAVAGSIIRDKRFNHLTWKQRKVEPKTNERNTKQPRVAAESRFRRRRCEALRRQKKRRRPQGRENNLREILKTHFARAGQGDYFALLGYITRIPRTGCRQAFATA